MKIASRATASASQKDADDFGTAIDALRAQFASVAGAGYSSTDLFVTEVPGADVWNTWLTALPESEHAGHTCHACRRFVEQHGNLVTIDAQGATRSAFFGNADGIYADAHHVAAQSVEFARVVGVHASSEKTWGTPTTRDPKRGCTWRHFSVTPPAGLVYQDKIKTAGQHAAELLENYGTLCRALDEFSDKTVGQALQIARSEALNGSEKIVERLEWLADLYAKRTGARKVVGDNLTWLAVASAPVGWAHVKSSIIGSLLEDLAAHKPFDDVRKAFNAKMHPLKYLRPTAAPSAGNIAQAEKIVEKLGIEPSLRRRYARIEDIAVKTWEPSPPRPSRAPAAGVFSALLPRSTPEPTINTTGPTMTWAKFAKQILPSVEALEVEAPYRGSYHALVTAADPSAPLIFQWPNPVNWYTYHRGSEATQWNLIGGRYVPVTAVTPMPNTWQPGFEHRGSGVILILEGCRDRHGAEIALFPEHLKSELHSVRSTLEAHSKRGRIEGRDEASACGIAIRNGHSDAWQVKVRATVGNTRTTYTIDRWD